MPIKSRARKEYICELCDRPINKGDTYYKTNKRKYHRQTLFCEDCL